MNMVTVSAPGKVILMGEHAVVYGKPAITAAIHLRMRVSIEKSNIKNQQSPSTLLKIENVHIKNQKKEIQRAPEELLQYVTHIQTIVRRNTRATEQSDNITLTYESDIPYGYHLGSSAAIAVCTVGALLYFYRRIWNPMLINQLAYEAEKFIHINSSGVDPAAVVSGGLIWYRKELEFLRSIWSLPFSIPMSLNHFYLVDTGRPSESTGEMVALVKSKIKSQKLKIMKQFDHNEQQTKRVALAIKEENEKELVDAIKQGEQTLEKMGVVSKYASSIVQTIELAGGAAKILGGGGRKHSVGFLLCYHTNEEVLRHAVGNVPLQPVTLGGEGVKLEEKDI